jgi:hypothetical protein
MVPAQLLTGGKETMAGIVTLKALHFTEPVQKQQQYSGI